MNSRARFRALPSIALSVALTFAAPALAAWPTDPAVNLAVSTVAGIWGPPVVVADGEGGVFIAWPDIRNGESDLFATHLRADGTPHAGWPVGGLPVVTASGYQIDPVMTSDGNGGALIAWLDGRLAGNYDGYAHHLLASGLDPAWPVNGLQISAASGDQYPRAICGDGTGGAIVAWEDLRAGNFDVYAQRVLPDGTVDPAWPVNGRAICTASNGQIGPLILGDDAGNAIVAWTDYRSATNYDVYAARVLGSGVLDPFWPANGRALVSATGNQMFPSLAGDGTGGAIVAWKDNRAGGDDVYAQHVSRSGEVDTRWPANGLAVATLAVAEANPAVASDGAGGAYVAFTSHDATEGATDLWIAWITAEGVLNPAWFSGTYGSGRLGAATEAGAVSDVRAAACGSNEVFVAWRDTRNGNNDLFATRFGPAGPSLRWPDYSAGGLAVSSAPNSQQDPVLEPDGTSGFVLAWRDARGGGAMHLYAQRVTRFAALGMPEPEIEGVVDVASDQGGRVHVLWTPASGDGGGLETIRRYTVWRRATPETWDFLADVPARAAPGYAFMAPTVGDSSWSGTPWTTFRVLAHDSSYGVVLASVPDSGFSRDDLVPAAPSAFLAVREGGRTFLRWSGSTEPDHARYRLYRGSSPDFVPDASRLVAEPVETSFEDAAPPPCWYRLSAVDAHGNEGAAASFFLGVSAGGWSGEDWPYHPMQNLPVTLEGLGQSSGAIVPDDYGGAYIFYAHYPGGSGDTEIRAAHLLAAGGIDETWPPQGAPVCVAAGHQAGPTAVPRTGGALVAWVDYRADGYADIYCTRLASTGLPSSGWPTDGLGVCTASGSQNNPRIVVSASDGAVILWSDDRSGSWDVYAQRVLGSGAIAWTANGVAVATGGNGQSLSHAVSDGSGGAYVAWRDEVTGAVYVHHLLVGGTLDAAWPAGGRLVHANATYARLVECFGGVIVISFDGAAALVARRLTSAGVFDPAWPSGGVPLVASMDVYAHGVPDGANGAMVAWAERPSVTQFRVAVQHVTASGALHAGWPTAGVTVRAGRGIADAFVVLSSDGEPLVTWDEYDAASGLQNVYAQRVAHTGVVDPAWPAGGRAVCLAAGREWVTGVCPDAGGGSLVVWDDERTGAGRVFTQRVERSGVLGHPEPLLTSVIDTPGDQGGAVRVSWRASLGEYPPFHGITEYTLWRRLTLEGVAAARARGAALFSAGAGEAPRPGMLRRVETAAAGSTWWEYVATVPASGLDAYAATVPTTADSLPGEVFWNVFFVDAQDTSYAMNLFYPSAPDSGYSVDNLAPPLTAPAFGFYANGSTSLHWPVSPAPDLASYRIYRNVTRDFPGPDGLVASVSDTGYVDSPGRPYYYFLNAVDAHGNASPNGLIEPNGILDAPPGTPPAALRFGPARPNPARGQVLVPLALPRAAHVKITVLDVAGRRVKRIADGRLPAGDHAVRWDGTDETGQPRASGLYFVRLEVEGRTLHARIVRAT